MATTQKIILGTTTTLMGSANGELNSLANGAAAIAAVAWDNTQGNGGGDGYAFIDVEIYVPGTSTPTANYAVNVWWLSTVDGTNYETQSTGATPNLPGRNPDVVLSTGPNPQASWREVKRQLVAPTGVTKAYVQNSTGVAFPASGATLKVRPSTFQGV